MEEQHVSKAVIRRLPRYYRFLGDLLAEGVERISSGELSERMGVTASQIRQDLNQFGGFGQQGYGYRVRFLYDEIEHIMGLDQTHHVILIGAGNLGSALAGYTNYRKRNFIIEAVFDKDPGKIGKTLEGLEILSVDTLEQYLSDHRVDIAAIAIPREEAVSVAERLVRSGVRAIWNFAHTDLEVPDDVVVENVHLSESLMSLSYKAKMNREKPDGKKTGKH